MLVTDHPKILVQVLLSEDGRGQRLVLLFADQEAVVEVVVLLDQLNLPLLQFFHFSLQIL